MGWNPLIQRALDKWHAAFQAGDVTRAERIVAELRLDGIVLEGSAGGWAWWRVSA